MHKTTKKSWVSVLFVAAAAMTLGACAGDDAIGPDDVVWDSEARQCTIGGVPASVNGATSEEACDALRSAAEGGSLAGEELWTPGLEPEAICCEQDCTVTAGGGWSCGPMSCGKCAV